MTANNLRRWAPAIGAAAVFVVLRLPLLGFPYYGDEEGVVIEALLPLGQCLINGHPILLPAFLKLGVSLLGWEQLRWVPFLFSLALLGLTWTLADELIGRRGAILAAWLFALSPWNVSVSTQVEFDGAVFAFFATAFVLFYARLAARGNLRDLLLAGASFGLLWLSKISALVIFAGLALHSLLFRGVKKTAGDFGVMLGIGAAIFSIYPVFFFTHYHAASQKTASVLGLISQKLSLSPGLYANCLAKTLIFMGPLFLWGFLRTLLAPAERRRLALPLVLAISYIAVLLILLFPHRITIYWSALIPVFCVMTAQAMLGELGETDYKRLAAGTLLYAAGLAVLTCLGPYSVQAIHPRVAFSLRGLFEFLPIRHFSGPSTSFFVKPAAVLLAFGLCGALWLASRKIPRLRVHAICLGLAYALFYSAEYSYSPLSPNLNKAGQAVFAYIQEHPPKTPVYLHGSGALAYKMAGVKTFPFMYDVGFLPHLMERMEKTKGTVVIVNTPAIGKATPLMEFLGRKAVLTKSFADSALTVAEVWTLK